MAVLRTEIVGRWSGTADVGGVSVQAELEAHQDVYSSGMRGPVRWEGTITRDEELESWGLTEPGEADWIECSSEGRWFTVKRASRRLIYIKGRGFPPFMVVKNTKPVYVSSGKRRAS